MTLKYGRPIRGAFTLTELLVAMALSIGIMWILAEAFKMGLDFTSHARSVGSQMSQLDGARAVIARDLLAEHFYPDDNLPNRGVRLSDHRFDWMNNAGQGWSPPKGGFFRIISPVPATLSNDPDGYSMNTAVNHALHFTSILPASEQQLYSVNSPAGGSVTCQSRAAEVAYFLVDSGRKTSATGNTLYYLARRQRLLAMTNDDKSALSTAAADTEAIAGSGVAPSPYQPYTLAEITNPGIRLPISPSTLPGGGSAPPTFGITNARYGEDMLLDNVLSFEVMVDWTQSGVTGSTFGPRTTAVGNWDSPFDFLGAQNAGQNTIGSGVFDTWVGSPTNPTWNVGFGGAPNAQKLPLAIRVKAIQITVRIWDPKTKLARQSTWRLAM
jgi:hypothetical protein